MSDNDFDTTIADLQGLLTWPDGWNSYDALAPKPEAVIHATMWIREVYQYLIETQQQWTKPDVTATGDGDVHISWYHGPRELYVTVEEQDIHYLQAWSRDINAKLTDGDINSIDDMHNLWQWLLNTPQSEESTK